MVRDSKPIYLVNRFNSKKVKSTPIKCSRQHIDQHLDTPSNHLVMLHSSLLRKIIPCPRGVEAVSGERVETSLGPRDLRMGERGGCEERRCALTQLGPLPEVESSSPPRARDPLDGERVVCAIPGQSNIEQLDLLQERPGWQ